jgi:hypothetical protein
MNKEREEQPVTRYEELCGELYRDLHALTFGGKHYFRTAEGENLDVAGWHDVVQINHGYSRSAWGFAIQILGDSRDILKETISIRDIRIETVHDYYHYKDWSFHFVARELKPKKSIFGKTTYEWVEIPESEAYLADNWLTQLQKKIRSCR